MCKAISNERSVFCPSFSFSINIIKDAGGQIAGNVNKHLKGLIQINYSSYVAKHCVAPPPSIKPMGLNLSTQALNVKGYNIIMVWKVITSKLNG